MKRFVLVGVVLATLFALASPAAARHTTCTDTLTGAVPGDVIVPEGESCIITNATVGDDVKVGEGAFVEVRNSQIADDVKANRSDGIFIDTGTTVGEDISTYRTFVVDVFGATVGDDIWVSRAGTAVHICGNEVADNIVVTKSNRDIQVGDPGQGGCDANTVGDDVEIERNSDLTNELIVRGNTIADDLEVNHNRGNTPFKAVENNVGGDELECRGNEEPFTASGNTGWDETEGQCEIPPTECNTAPSDDPILVNAEGDLIVPNNGICVLAPGSTVGGNVFVGRGGYFEARNSQIAGEVEAKGANGVFLNSGTTVGGDVETSGGFTVDVFDSAIGDDIEVSRAGDPVHICGNTVGEDVEVERSAPEVQVGDPGEGGCAPNSVTGDIEVEDNDVTYLSVRGNTVGDDLEVTENEGATQFKFVQNNTGGDRLECWGNDEPFVGSPNPGFARVVGDQCSVT